MRLEDFTHCSSAVEFYRHAALRHAIYRDRAEKARKCLSLSESDFAIRPSSHYDDSKWYSRFSDLYYQILSLIKKKKHSPDTLLYDIINAAEAPDEPKEHEDAKPQPSPSECLMAFKSAAIYPSDHPLAGVLTKRLDRLLDRIYALKKIPELAGKTTVCYIGFRDKPRNGAIPTLTFHGNEKDNKGTSFNFDANPLPSTVENPLHHAADLRISPQCLYTAFTRYSSLVQPDEAVIIIPPGCVADTPLFRPLLAAADIVFLPEDFTIHTAEAALGYLNDSRSPALVVPPKMNHGLENLKGLYPFLCTVPDRETARNLAPGASHSALTEHESVFYELQMMHAEKLLEFKRIQKAFRDDFIRGEDAGSKRHLKELHNAMDEEIRHLGLGGELKEDKRTPADHAADRGKRFSFKGSEEAEALAKSIRSELAAFDPYASVENLETKNLHNEETLFHACLLAGRKAYPLHEAERIRRTLAPSHLSSLLSLSVSCALRQSPGPEALEFLNKIHPIIHTHLIHKICLHFGEKLGLSEEEIRIHALAADCFLPEELYQLGRTLLKDGTAEEGVKFLMQAAFRGSGKASDLLYENRALLDSKEYNDLLHTLLNPRLLCDELSKATDIIPAYGSLLFALSAALGFSKAVLAFARAGKASLANYAYLYEHHRGVLSPDDMAQYGMLLYKEHSYRDAITVLESCRNGSSKARYLLAIMYENGCGVAIDKEKANTLRNWRIHVPSARPHRNQASSILKFGLNRHARPRWYRKGP